MLIYNSKISVYAETLSIVTKSFLNYYNPPTSHLMQLLFNYLKKTTTQFINEWQPQEVY